MGQEDAKAVERVGVKELAGEVDEKRRGEWAVVGEGEEEAGRAAQQRDALRAEEREGVGGRAGEPGKVGEESVQQTRHTVDEVRGGEGGDGGDGVLGEESAHPLPAGEDSRGGVEDEEAGGNRATGAAGGEETEWMRREEGGAKEGNVVRGEGKWGEWGMCGGVDKVRCGIDEKNWG